MKDATKVKNLLNKHEIKLAAYAKAIGTSKQNVGNMFRLNNMSKNFLLPSVLYLRELGEDVTVDWLLEDNHLEKRNGSI